MANTKTKKKNAIQRRDKKRAIRKKNTGKGSSKAWNMLHRRRRAAHKMREKAKEVAFLTENLGAQPDELKAMGYKEEEIAKGKK